MFRFSPRAGAFVTLAKTSEEHANALEIQNIVFSKKHLDPWTKGIDTIHKNPYDYEAEIFVVISEGKIIGTTSINRENPEFAQRFQTICGLPIEEFYDISNLAMLAKDLVQVRNAAVLTEFRNRRIGPLIWGEIYRTLTTSTQVSEYAVILAASEIRDLRTVNAVFQKAINDGFYYEERAVTLKVAPCFA